MTGDFGEGRPEPEVTCDFRKAGWDLEVMGAPICMGHSQCCVTLNIGGTLMRWYLSLGKQ